MWQIKQAKRAPGSSRRQRRNWRPLIEACEARLLLASSLVNFDPTGGAGANSNDVLDVSSFTWLPGNILAEGGGSLTVGQDVPVLYQAIQQSINTAGSGNSTSL